MRGMVGLAGACIRGGSNRKCATATTNPPSQEPQFRIDPDMHTGAIWRIGVNAPCTLLATGSDDKTVRIWGLPEGRLIHTLRPPIGPGENGKIQATTMAPDGSWIAVGGRDGVVYIFHVATARMLTRLGPFGSGIHQLAASRDGQYLAVTLLKGGLRVWQRKGPGLAAWQRVTEDKNYGGESSYGAAFDNVGTLYTVAFDGRLRRYSGSYTSQPIFVETRGGRQPYSVAVHPSGARVAVGFIDSAMVDVYDAASLTQPSEI